MPRLHAEPQPEDLFTRLVETQMYVEGMRAIATAVGEEHLSYLTGSALDRLFGVIDEGIGDCIEYLETMATNDEKRRRETAAAPAAPPD